jgi:hypothetical protein
MSSKVIGDPPLSGLFRSCERYDDTKWHGRKGRLTMEEIIFSLKHYWRFVDSEPLELKALSQGGDEIAA